MGYRLKTEFLLLFVRYFGWKVTLVQFIKMIINTADIKELLCNNLHNTVYDRSDLVDKYYVNLKIDDIPQEVRFEFFEKIVFAFYEALGLKCMEKDTKSCIQQFEIGDVGFLSVNITDSTYISMDYNVFLLTVSFHEYYKK